MAEPRPVRWLILFGVWSIYAMFGLIGTSLAPLVQRLEADLAMSHSQMGTVMGAWQLMFIAAAIPCGILLDRLGSRYALLIGAASIALSAWGRSLAVDHVGMLAAVMVFGIGGPVISAGAPKVIAQWFEGPSRGLAMGLYVTGPAIGATCALTLTHGWLMPLFDGNWRGIFQLWALLAAGAGVVWFLIASLPACRSGTGPMPVEHHLPHRRVIRDLIAQPSVRLVMLMGVGVFMISHGLMNWLPELLVAGGMSKVAAGYWAALPTLVGIVGALVIPRMAVPHRRFAILSGLCLSVLLSTLLLQSHTTPLLATGLVLQGIARATLMTVLVLTLVELPQMDVRHTGTAAGMFFSAAEVGGMLGPVSIGVAYEVTHGFASGLALFSLIAFGLVVATGRLQRITAQAT